MTGPVRATLADGRAHFHHGPIDLVIAADGAPGAVAAAGDAAWARFETVLTELVEELALLRTPMTPAHPGVAGPVARRMAAAGGPHAAKSVLTPMAAVAGAVADEIVAAMAAAAPLRRIAVNNGGDVAVRLAPGATFRLMIADHAGKALDRIAVTGGDGIGGIATSGRHGRSHSLGIADSVTVLAHDAAAADVAATLIANAVDLPGHPAVERIPARDLDPDSDLGDRPVTVTCAALSPGEREAALAAGLAAARGMQAGGLIAAAFLHLQGDTQILGAAPAVPHAA